MYVIIYGFSIGIGICINLTSVSLSVSVDTASCSCMRRRGPALKHMSRGSGSAATLLQYPPGNLPPGPQDPRTPGLLLGPGLPSVRYCQAQTAHWPGPVSLLTFCIALSTSPGTSDLLAPPST